jgi:HD-GYP domain-containing protein (c-di-GMP phosphodiesterase class II)
VRRVLPGCPHTMIQPLRQPTTDLDRSAEAGAILCAVSAAARRIAATTTHDGVLRAAAHELRVILDASACWISRIDGGDTLVDAAIDSIQPWLAEGDTGYLICDYPVTAEVLETGVAHTTSLADADVDPSEAYALRGVRMQSVLMLRLRVDDRAWGLVEVFDAGPRRFDRNQMAVAELVLVQVELMLGRFAHEEEVQRLYRETLASLSNALEAKDDYTSVHAQEVSELAVEVGRRVGLEDDALRAVELGALLHDIGKIRIPESILNKPGPLSPDEWDVMRGHPAAGETILAPIAALASVLPIVRSSHERWDGCGYPDRLEGDDIPVGARVVAVCDAYRAMVEPRPYRREHDPVWALAELQANAGTQFDPACVEALLAVVAEPHEDKRRVRLHRPDHLRQKV